MEEKKIEEKDNEIIKAIKEEYEKKIAEIEEKHKEEIEKVRNEEQEKSIKQIRAIISGRDDGKIAEKEKEEEEKSDFDIALEETRKNFGLK